MATKTYPVGTKIRYIGPCRKCKNEIGLITKVEKIKCYIHLPKSPCSRAIAGSFYAEWEYIELLPQKNQQLLFDFMSATEGT